MVKGLWDRLIDRARRLVHHRTRKRSGLQGYQETTKEPAPKIQDFSKTITNDNKLAVEGTLKSSQVARGSPISLSRHAHQHSHFQHDRPIAETQIDHVQREHRISPNFAKDYQMPRNSISNLYLNLNTLSSHSTLSTLHSDSSSSDTYQCDNGDLLRSEPHQNVDKGLSSAPSQLKNDQGRVSDDLIHRLEKDDDDLVRVNYTTHNRAPVIHDDVYPHVHTIYEPRRTRSIHLHEHVFYIQPVIDTSGPVSS